MIVFAHPLAAELLTDEVLPEPDHVAVAVLAWGRIDGQPHFLVVDRTGQAREVVTPDVRITDPGVQETAARAAEQIRVERAAFEAER
jgi:hypothetical protein